VRGLCTSHFLAAFRPVRLVKWRMWVAGLSVVTVAAIGIRMNMGASLPRQAPSNL